MTGRDCPAQEMSFGRSMACRTELQIQRTGMCNSMQRQGKGFSDMSLRDSVVLLSIPFTPLETIMSTVAPDVLVAYNQRLNTLDRRVTRVEAIMTTTTPHLATKADVKAATNTLLYWLFGLLVGLATLFYAMQGRMEDRLNQRVDRLEQRFEQRFERLEDLILQSKNVPPPADAASH